MKLRCRCVATCFNAHRSLYNFYILPGFSSFSSLFASHRLLDRNSVSSMYFCADNLYSRGSFVRTRLHTYFELLKVIWKMLEQSEKLSLFSKRDRIKTRSSNARIKRRQIVKRTSGDNSDRLWTLMRL